jgi:hypothetical protein
MKILLEQPQEQNVTSKSNVAVSKGRKTRQNTKQYSSLVDKIKKDKKDSNAPINLDPDFGSWQKSTGYWIKEHFWDKPNEYIREFFVLGLTYDDTVEKYRKKSDTTLAEDLAIVAQGIPALTTLGFDATIKFVREQVENLGNQYNEFVKKINQLDVYLKEKLPKGLTGKGYATSTNRAWYLQDASGFLENVIGIIEEMNKTRNAVLIFDPQMRNAYYDKNGKLNKRGQEAIDNFYDWQLEQKTGLNKQTREYNKNRFLTKFQRNANKVIDNADEEIKEETKQEIIANAKKALSEKFKSEPEIFNRLKKYENIQVSEIIEDPKKISEIVITTQTAMKKLEENAKEKKIDLTSNELTQLTNAFLQLEKFKTDLLPQINEKFKGIDDKTKKELTNYFKNYGIFDLSKKSKEDIGGMYNDFNKLDKQNADQILSQPFTSHNNPTLNTNLLKKKILQLSIYSKILDNALYQINHFTDLLLTSSLINKSDQDATGITKENTISSMTTNNLLNVVMGLMKTELNNKLNDKDTGKLNINNMDDILSPVTKLGNFEFGSVDTPPAKVANAFYASKMLNVNDKIVGIFSQKTIVNNLLNNSEFIARVYAKIQSLPKYLDSQKPLLKEAFLKKFNRIPIITSLILLSNHGVIKNSNEIEKKYYYLYQLDISKIYEVLFDDQNFFDAFLDIRFKGEDEGEDEEEITNKKISDYNIVEPTKIEYTNQLQKKVTDANKIKMSIFDIRKYIKTNADVVQTIELEIPELKDIANFEDLNYETFSFEDKELISRVNKEEFSETNPEITKKLSDLFVKADLADLISNKNIFR